MRSEVPASVQPRNHTEVSTQVARELFLRAFIGGGNPDVSGDAATRLAGRVVDMWLPKGQTLYRIGDPPVEHYFVVDGEIEVSGPMGSLFLGERSIVGIIDVTQDRPRNRTATATRDTHLLRVTAADWFDVLEDDFDFALGAIHNIARGLISMHLGSKGRAFEGSASSQRPRAGTLSFVDRTLLLRSVPPFRRASVQATVELIPHTKVRHLEAGDVLFEAGAPKHSLLVVADGSIALVTEGLEATLGSGSLIGGMGSLSPDPWPCEARAVTRSRVLEIELEDLFDAMEEHFDLVRAALAELSGERERIQAFESPRPQ